MEWLASLLVKTGIAAFGDSFFKPYLTHLDNRDAQAAQLAGREMAVQQRESELATQLKVAEIGHPFEPEKLFAYIIVIYFAKIVLWDKVIGSFMGQSCFRGVCSVFNTDTLTGDAIGWAAMVMTFYFGKRGIENVARIWKAPK